MVIDRIAVILEGGRKHMNEITQELKQRLEGTDDLSMALGLCAQIRKDDNA